MNSNFVSKITYFQIFFLVVLVVGLAACSPSSTTYTTGASIAGMGSSASTALPTPIIPTGTGTSAVTQDAYVQCDHSSGGSGSFAVDLAAYMQNAVARFDLMYVKLSTVPSGFTSDKSYIQFFRGMGSGASGTYIDPTALSISILSKSSGVTLLSGTNWIRWSDISAVAASMGFSNNPSGFFQNVLILVNLNDVAGTYEVMSIGHYSSSGALLDKNAALLPVYNADPAKYAVKANGTARSSALVALHPFNGQSGLSVTQLQNSANALCNPFN